MSFLHPRVIFIKNPSAASIVENPATDPSFRSTVHIFGDGRNNEGSLELPAGQTDVQYCEAECSVPCVNQVISVTFPAVAFGTGCDGCAKDYGINIRRERDEMLRLDDSHYLMNDLPFEFPLVGNQTAIQMATEFERQLIANEESNGGHGLWQATFVRSGATVTITFPCEQFFTIDFRGEGFATNELPTITVVNPGLRSALTPANIRRIYPLYAYGNQLTFENVGASFFSECQAACYIDLKGCWNWGCGTEHEYNNNGTTTPNVNQPFTARIWYNAAAAGANAFITALRARYTSCNASTTLGNRPLVNNQVLRSDKKSTGGATSIGLGTSQFTSSLPVGYSGPVKITVTSTVATPSPAINATVIVPASVANDPAQVVAAFTAAGYTFLAYTSPNYVITTGKTSDDVTMAYLIP